MRGDRASLTDLPSPRHESVRRELTRGRTHPVPRPSASDDRPSGLAHSPLSAPTFDLLSGTSALFSFLRPLDANQRDYLVAGFGETDIFTNTGQIAGPG